MLIQPTVEKLRQMRLKGMVDGLLAQEQNPDYASLTFAERFGLLVDQEWTARQDRLLSRLLRAANLRLAACPEDIDYQQPRGLDRAVMASLIGGQWLHHHQNVIITSARL